MAPPMLSFRVEEKLVEKLDRLAQATDRDLARYLESEPLHMNAIAEGIADADAGNLTDLKAIKTKWVNRAKHPVGGQSGKCCWNHS